MSKYSFLIRNFLKNKKLRIVNILGLSLLFACLLISYTYVKHELSYDKFYSKADRVMRLSAGYDGQPADGRLYGYNFDQILKSISSIDEVLQLANQGTVVLKRNGEQHVLTNLYFSSQNLFDVLDIPLLSGDSKTAFSSPNSVVISEKLAYQLFGKTDVVGENIELSGRKFQTMTSSITGVFKDMPTNTHFRTDIIVSQSNIDNYIYYCYLLLSEGQNKEALVQDITTRFLSENTSASDVSIDLMPITDIHLHSHVLREMEPNGNINYVYLIVGSNILLFIIVAFNLWLNSTIIFSSNKRYYQLLRLNGASSVDVIKDEFYIVGCFVAFSVCLGALLSVFVAKYFVISFDYISMLELICLTLIFLLVAIFISLIPVLANISSTFFYQGRIDFKVGRFSFSKARYMLVVQYSIVVLIIIITLGINSQIQLIMNSQVGGTNSNIVVFDEQPQTVIDNYSLLKNELLKYSEIESVTGAMQLPGSAVRDMVGGRIDNEDRLYVPVLIVGEDFFSFYNLKLLSGSVFPPLKMSLAEEQEIVFRRIDEGVFSTLEENVILNQKALQSFGFRSPDEAIGKEIEIEHSMLNYTQTGRICGIVDDFIYTNIYDENIPMILLQRNMFMNCFMVKLMPGKEAEGAQVLKTVWNKINPDYPMNYGFLEDTYNHLYKNELNASKSVQFFSFVCLVITLLGLVVFMEFMIKSRTKEIGIRKINGASWWNIIKMLNLNLLKWMLISTIIAIPLSWVIMEKWLENFAYKATLSWWVFVASGIFVSVVSLIAVSLQSWKASKINPIECLKNE